MIKQGVEWILCFYLKSAGSARGRSLLSRGSAYKHWHQGKCLIRPQYAMYTLYMNTWHWMRYWIIICDSLNKQSNYMKCLLEVFKKAPKFIWLRIRKKGSQRRQSFIFWPEYFRYAGQLVQLVSVKLVLQPVENEKQGNKIYGCESRQSGDGKQERSY